MTLLRRLLTYLVAFFLKLIDWLSYQIRLLLTYFNPVKMDSQHLTFTRLSFLPVFVFLLFIYIYGLYCLGPELTFHRAFDLDYYRTDAHVYYHKLNAPSSWPISDVINITDSIRNLLAIGCTFLCSRLSNESVLLLLPPKRGNSKLARQSEEMSQMCAFQRKERTFLQLYTAVYFIVDTIFIYKLAYDSPRVNATPRELLYLFVLPLGRYYIHFTNQFLILFGIITVKYTLIRQRSVLGKLKALAKSKEKGGRPIRVDSFWHAYSKLNRQSMALCKVIGEYARFWNVFGTLCFAGYITTVTYETYVQLFVFPSRKTKLFIILFWINSSLLHMGLILLYTRVCSPVVKANGAILAEHRRLYWQLCRPLAEKRHFSRLLRVQGLACEGRLDKYSFTIFGCHRITARTFNEILYFTSAFFFMTVERYRK